MEIVLGEATIAKLASIVVHADELISDPVFSIVNATQIMLAIRSKEVQDFIQLAGALAPVRRP